MICSGVSIKGMKCFAFNAETGEYEQVLELERIGEIISGKSAVEIAEEYNDITRARARQYAAERKLPYFGTADDILFYMFDCAAEEAFVNRPRKSPGRPFVEKPVKIPGKPGRPRKEKPVDTSPKRPVGRPCKNPKDGFDVVPKKNRVKPKKRK
jgi:hypothetical protein